MSTQPPIQKPTRGNLGDENEFYRLLYQNSSDAILLTIPDGRILSANPAACSMFGMSEEELCHLGRGGVVDISDPRLVEGLKIRESTGRFKGELTGIRKDGTKFPTEISSVVFVGQNGELRTSMVIRDITDRKQLEAQLQELARCLPDAVYILDLEKHECTFFNHDSFLGYSRDELMAPGSIFSEQHPNDAAAVQLHWEKIMQGGDAGNIEYRIRNKAGQWDWIESREVIMSLDSAGKPKEVMVVLTLITERKQIEEELRRARDSLETTNRELQQAFTREQVLARTDSLTGIFNRRHFFGLAEQEFIIANRYHQIISVIIFDIDHFKRVNDTFGHQVGDELLQHVARIARENLRGADVLARHGGEEFIVLLPNSNGNESKVVAERIRENIAAYHLGTERGKVSVTVSIGVAELTHEQETIDHLIRCADQALYKAKKTGRNRTVVYAKMST